MHSLCSFAEAGVEHATSESKPEDFQQPHTPPIDDEIVFISETKAVPDVIIVSDDEDDIIDLTADDSGMLMDALIN